MLVPEAAEAIHILPSQLAKCQHSTRHCVDPRPLLVWSFKVPENIRSCRCLSVEAPFPPMGPSDRWMQQRLVDGSNGGGGNVGCSPLPPCAPHQKHQRAQPPPSSRASPLGPSPG